MRAINAHRGVVETIFGGPVSGAFDVPRAMFGSIINRFQTFSPATSPVTSPKMSRRKYKSPAHRRSLKDEYRDVQSEPEDACLPTIPTTVGYRRGGQPVDGSAQSSSAKKNRGGRKHPLLLSKSKSTARLDISAPTGATCTATALGNNYHHGSKSMGRLDGLKQVHNMFIIFYFLYFFRNILSFSDFIHLPCV